MAANSKCYYCDSYRCGRTTICVKDSVADNFEVRPLTGAKMNSNYKKPFDRMAF